MSDMNERLIEALEEAEALAAENAKLREEVERLKAEANEIRAQAVEDFGRLFEARGGLGEVVANEAIKYANNLRNQAKG